MNVELKKPEQLTAEELSAWEHHQATNPALDSPYFRPEFTQVASSVRDDVEVAVIRNGSGMLSFFPFQRHASKMAKPVGGRLSDYQGIIAAEASRLDLAELLRQCRLSVWDFDHVVADQDVFAPYRRLTDLSPYLNLARGFDEYRKKLRRSGRNELKDTLRKGRKIEREIGPLRLEFSSDCDAMFDLLKSWKSQQYTRTQVTNVFAFSWTTELLRQIWQLRKPRFAGVLSVLYAGDQPIAAHFGMRTDHVLHGWFPAYAPEFRYYSPGRVMFAELAQACPEQGIRKFDLGRGVVPYKARAMSGATPVLEGSVDLRPVARRLRNTWRVTRKLVRNSAFYGAARIPARLLHRFQEWHAFR